MFKGIVLLVLFETLWQEVSTTKATPSFVLFEGSPPHPLLGVGVQLLEVENDILGLIFHPIVINIQDLILEKNWFIQCIINGFPN
jgi:hypothetical protein